MFSVDLHLALGIFGLAVRILAIGILVIAILVIEHFYHSFLRVIVCIFTRKNSGYCVLISTGAVSAFAGIGNFYFSLDISGLGN